MAAVRRPTRLLIASRKAGGFTDDVEAALRRYLADFTEVEFDPAADVRRLVSPRATVVVAGGDGSIGVVARRLAGTERRLGLIPVGTYNNFARSLGIPDDPARAAKLVLEGSARPVTLGMINRHPFLEFSAAGFFGEAIELGESLKDGDVGAARRQFVHVAGAKPFEYRLTGDLDASGRALSLVVTNTPTTGARMPLADTTPAEPTLALAAQVGASRTDLVGRMLAGVFLDRHVDSDALSFRFSRIELHTKPRVHVYADSIRVGRTPVTIAAAPSALRVFAP